MIKGLRRPNYQKTLGSFMLGTESVNLVARDGTGGELYTAPEAGHPARIKIGLDDSWDSVCGTLLHEAMEFVMIRMELSYRPTTDWSGDNGASTFIMTHTQFSEAIQRVGSYATKAVPALSAEYRAWQRRAKKKP